MSNEDQLALYGLFKQANMGDNETGARVGRVGSRRVASRRVEVRAAHAHRLAARPGFLDMKGKAKWDAWTANKGACARDAASATRRLARASRRRTAADAAALASDRARRHGQGGCDAEVHRDRGAAEGEVRVNGKRQKALAMVALQRLAAVS